MRKSLTLKTLLRSPLKTLLTFFLIAAASFALFSRITDYAVTTRETESVKSLYHAVASLDNEVPDVPMMVATVLSSDGSVLRGYDTIYEMEDKPWLTEEELAEFASLPGVTLADTSYMTAGQVEDYKRIVGEGEFGGSVVFEGTYAGEDESTLEDHIRLKFEDVRVIACDGGPEVETAFTTEYIPLGETYYAKSPYARAFYDGLEIGSRCLVLADNTGQSFEGSSGIYFRPYATGEGALCVIDGQPDNYLETEAFARQKGWVDAINFNNYAYDIVYTSDMRVMGFREQSIKKGRLLTAEDTDACVVSEEFLNEHGLSIGDSISVQLGDLLCHGSVKAETEVRDGYMPDEAKIPQFVENRELTIVGAYPDPDMWSPNTIYVPSALLPVEVPDDYEPRALDFGVFVEDADDIEAFHKAAEQFADKVDLRLDFSDRGWLDVKDSFAMGAFTSLLTTALYIVGAALALFLAVYLYIGRNKKSYAIMRMLGVPGKAAGNAVVLPFAAVSVFAAPVGGIAGLYYAQRTAEKALLGMADSAPAGYVPSAELPLGVIIVCLISELLFVTLAAYIFLRSMKKTPPLELLQEGTKQGTKAENRLDSPDAQANTLVSAKLDLAKISAAGEWTPQRKYRAVRHVSAYIWRHMRRGFGKTAVSLVLAVVLAAGIGTFVLARITYQDAFYEFGVKGNAANFAFSSVVDLSKSPLIKEFYCRESFSARVQGMESVIPMTVTSDLTRNLGKDCTVNYAQGYDLSAFEGTGQVCLVGKELAEKLGVSPGDEIGLMSDFLHSMLETSEQGESAVDGGYKTYKVIGIAESDDVSVKGGIFAGIRSDLQRLFSIEFSVADCEFTLADNQRLDELDVLLAEKESESLMYSSSVTYSLDSGGLANIERIRGLLDSLFPIAVAAAVLIGLFGPLLVILQSAQEAAFLRILGVTKKRARCMLAIEQIVLCIAGIVLVAGGLALYDPGRFASGIETFAVCFGLYLLGCVCGAVAASIQVTRHRLLELLQVKE